MLLLLLSEYSKNEGKNPSICNWNWITWVNIKIHFYAIFLICNEGTMASRIWPEIIKNKINVKSNKKNSSFHYYTQVYV